VIRPRQFIISAALLSLAALWLLWPSVALAADHGAVVPAPEIGIVSPSVAGWRGPLCLAIFALAYVVVVTEEFHSVRKSKPMILAAGAIWLIIATGRDKLGMAGGQLHEAALGELTGYSAMFLFLLVSMTYINAMNDRNVFAAMRSWLVRRGLSYRGLFWATGVMAFFLSSVVDNLISALLMGAIIMAIGGDNRKFIALACTNVVVAANAGGAFSPFGDITTLMIWQSGKLSFFEFFAIFVPSAVTFLVPAAIMSFFAPRGAPPAPELVTDLKPGARRICLLFALTILLAVSFEHSFGLPPFLGMMTGMSLLMFFTVFTGLANLDNDEQLDIYKKVGDAEWDTLLFFFGVIFSIGGLGVLGYLHAANGLLYGNLGPTTSNIILGAMSAVIDNIPVMFSILRMDPDMHEDQWLLITLTIGVGGSMLSIGSAAGVGLMGVAHGRYTFMSHLRWTPVIALGYAAGVGAHMLIHNPVAH
jgi:Na+/H+ antiporter NhaD/arsenite permease-like protein